MQISVKITRVTVSSFFFILVKPTRPHAGQDFYVFKNHVKDYGTIGKDPEVGLEGYMTISEYWYNRLAEYTPDQTDIAKVIQALQILIKYYPDAELGADHDVICVGPPMDVGKQGDVSVEDQERLGKLGWFFTDQDGRGWTMFT
jgi:hypothetical protein